MCFSEPGVIDVTLPAARRAHSVEQHRSARGRRGRAAAVAGRQRCRRALITWLRIRPSARYRGPVPVDGHQLRSGGQRGTSQARCCRDGTGEPDQAREAARLPCCPDPLRPFVTAQRASPTTGRIDDLTWRGRKCRFPIRGCAPGSHAARPAVRRKVFVLDAEAGEITFRRWSRGARPPGGRHSARRLRLTAPARPGNVGVGFDQLEPRACRGFTVTNPIPTWGGADAETVGRARRASRATCSIAIGW